MFSFLKSKPQKHFYKVSYCTSALIDTEKHIVTFDTSWMKEAYVAAVDLIDAQVEFAKIVTFSPHVYINRIEQVGQNVAVE